MITCAPAARCRQVSPPIEIEGEHYWDGGIVSNTPLWYVLDDFPRMDAFIIQVDLFNAIGEIPSKFDQVLEREKDIQYSSKTRFNTAAGQGTRRDTHDAEAAACQAPARARRRSRRPKAVKGLRGRKNHPRSPDQPPPVAFGTQSKDYEFSRATINELWAAGREDVRIAAAKKDWAEPEELWEGMRVYDLTR